MDQKGELAESYGYDEFGQDLYEKMEETVGRNVTGNIQPFGYTGYQTDGAGALSGALSFATANPYVLFAGNPIINTSAYCAIQKVHGEDITVEGRVISGLIGVVAGLSTYGDIICNE